MSNTKSLQSLFDSKNKVSDYPKAEIFEKSYIIEYRLKNLSNMTLLWEQLRK